MKKAVKLYKASEDRLVKGEKVTITNTNGCTVTTWIDFRKSGLVLLSRENMACWGFGRVVDVYKSRGYVEL
jgi:hypothetical protein